MLKRLNVDLGELETKAESLAKNGKTLMFTAVDGKATGIIAVADTGKEDPKEAIAFLLVMVTGENR